uniref:Cytochrome c6 n=1 Tax=Hildenbrandia rivularis TaxID=135206 RepID=A0A1C9CFK2_9FLOR|nr:cytochrome c553 [Hildenbrandia rivularis]AOM67163.1 cytochrome c553 [Hildenbrandia rivularis]
MLRKLFVIIVVLVNLLLVSSRGYLLAADLEHGEQVFVGNCAACHRGGENSIMPNKTLKKNVLEENSMYSVSAIMYQVKNGKNAMPAFGERLEDEDIQDVANYVLSQSEAGW